MHMSSSEVKAKTRFAGTQFPVNVRSGYFGSVAGHSSGFGPWRVQFFAARGRGLESPYLRMREKNDCPGVTPGCSSQPSLGLVALSWGRWYSMRSPGFTSIGGVYERAGGSEYTVLA